MRYSDNQRKATVEEACNDQERWHVQASASEVSCSKPSALFIHFLPPLILDTQILHGPNVPVSQLASRAVLPSRYPLPSLSSYVGYLWVRVSLLCVHLQSSKYKLDIDCIFRNKQNVCIMKVIHDNCRILKTYKQKRNKI